MGEWRGRRSGRPDGSRAWCRSSRIWPDLEPRPAPLPGDRFRRDYDEVIDAVYAGAPLPQVVRGLERTAPGRGNASSLNRPALKRRVRRQFASHLVESPPRLPTFPARWTLQDPRGRAYLVFWRDADGRLLPLRMEQCPEPDAVRISTPDGNWQRLQLVRRPLPRHAGDAVLYHCPSCWRPRRYLYPFAMVWYQLQHRLDVRCQACKGYRWQSQGAYRSALARAIQAALGVAREPTAVQVRVTTYLTKAP